MSDTDSSESAARPGSHEAGPDATEAFELLSNGTRLSILLALWEAYDPHAATIAVPFSDLQERVGVRDSGQFNYHLSKLEGPYVRKTGEGYGLQPLGLKLVGTVIAGAGRGGTLERTEIDYDCDLCGAPTAITYEDGWLFHVCTECDGGLGGRSEYPRGALFGEPFPPAALENRTVEEIFAAGVLRLLQVMAMKMGGLCPRCSGVVERTVAVCEDHAPTADVACGACGFPSRARIRWVCTVCKYRGGSSPAGAMVMHPAVVAFYHEHGVDFGSGINEFGRAKQALKLMRNHREELRSTDPLRLDVVIAYDGDELRLTLDERMEVVAAERSG
jgi:hypothetical protein